MTSLRNYTATIDSRFNNIKIGNCTGLKPAWTDVISTKTQFPVYPGTMVEVTCSGTFNMGSSQVTCASGTQFTYRIKPHCADLGKLKIV